VSTSAQASGLRHIPVVRILVRPLSLDGLRSERDKDHQKDDHALCRRADCWQPPLVVTAATGVLFTRGDTSKEPS
jgi:hypothetical protein